jgi:ArsR family transcriptional regulator, virulence genes transcriptional regulator
MQVLNLGGTFVIDNVKDIAELLKVLANENRLMIVCYLLESPMTVSELRQNINNLTQSALSQHLAMLKAYRILDSNKNGLSITYSIKDDRVRNVMKVLKQNYCDC